MADHVKEEMGFRISFHMEFGLHPLVPPQLQRSQQEAQQAAGQCVTNSTKTSK